MFTHPANLSLSRLLSPIQDTLACRAGNVTADNFLQLPPNSPCKDNANSVTVDSEVRLVRVIRIIGVMVFRVSVGIV